MCNLVSGGRCREEAAQSTSGSMQLKQWFGLGSSEEVQL